MIDQRLQGERPESDAEETQPVLTQQKRRRGQFNRPILSGDDWYVIGIASFSRRGRRL